VNDLNEQKLTVVVGLGATGLSCVRYLVSQNQPCMVVDSRSNPPGLDQLRKEYPQLKVELGGFNETSLSQAKELMMSPGVSLQTREIASAIASGVPVTGDIDLFSRLAPAPIVAVTGSNGKSTVVALLAEILGAAGREFAVGGNLDSEFGQPALDLLHEPGKELYVLELSSFQLETTEQLGAEVAVILNVSEDHMDRYADMTDYLAAKRRIFRACRKLVLNRDEDVSGMDADTGLPRWSYGFDVPGAGEVGLSMVAGEQTICFGGESVLAVSELKIVGRHNVANAMAATCLALALDIDLSSIRQGLQRFPGLPHRCQWVASVDGVDYYNDSKATNVGAAIAAVQGLGEKTAGGLVLIAGGDGKGADFSALAPVLQRWLKGLVLIGRDAERIAAVMDGSVSIQFASDLDAAVQQAASLAESGDAVLLSPACASLDMFENFKQRGTAFVQAVTALQ
jgi:UDP-N-acetylmuramoylalanine--D-glutamate ligase